MATGERLTLDPVTEDPARSPLDLAGVESGWGIFLLEHDYPAPDPDPIYAQSADTDGNVLVSDRYQNRVISVRVRVAEPNDPATTNLVTNPKAAIDATNYAGVGLAAGPTRTVPSVPCREAGADTAIQAQTDASADYVYHPVAVTNGEIHRFSVYVRLTALTATGVRAVVYNAAGAVKKATGATTLSAVDGTRWVRLDVGFTADATATWRVGVEQVGTGAATFEATGLMDEVSGSLTAYGDGDAPGWSWTGSADASTSTRPAPDGTRFWRIVDDLMEKLDRLKREGGTIRRYPGNSTVPIVFDVIRAALTEFPQDRRIMLRRGEIAFELECQPGGRAADLQVATASASTDELVFDAAAVPGDLPALGRLVITDEANKDEWGLWWGLQQRYRDTAADAALSYEAESRTPRNGASVQSRTGASGGNVVRSVNPLPTSFISLLSTQASGGGAHHTHVGDFEVLARVFDLSNALGGAQQVEMCLEYAQGDLLRRTRTVPVVVQPRGDFSIVSLGQVQLEPGRGWWEGRFLARDRLGAGVAQIELDKYYLRPVGEGGGTASVLLPPDDPSAYTSQASFSGTAGAAVTGTAPTFPTSDSWSGAGDSDDFVYSTPTGYAQRTAVSDGAFPSGRIITLPEALTDVVASVDFQSSDTGAGGARASQGLVCRYTNQSNFATVFFQPGAATSGDLISVSFSSGGSSVYSELLTIPDLASGTWYTLTFYADSRGRFCVWLGVQGAKLAEPLFAGYHSSLASGGALASGKSGILDYSSSAIANTRLYDNFAAWVPDMDASVFANRQAEVRWDQFRRQDAGGNTWSRPSKYEGDLLLVPPAGREGRVTRVFARASRNNPGMADPALVPISAALHVIPRYLEVARP